MSIFLYSKMDVLLSSRVFVLTLLLATLIKSIAAASDNTYKAAVVEYFPVQSTNLTPEQRTTANVDRYIEIINNLDDKDFDIIVYPEATITTGQVETRENILLLSTFVPGSSENVVPCNTANYPEFFKKLSCFARQLRSYIVVNLIEKEECNENTVPKSGECAEDGITFYNSDVVFDRSGAVIQRYRKYNLFGEYQMSVTKEVEVSTFDTDFNVTFGLFTCFDILFEKPALMLVRQGVKHIVFPTMWFSELPFLTALQAQTMFAVENDVVFLASGANSASRGSGGSGIYQGRLGAIDYDIIPNDDSKVYVADVYKEWNATTVLDDKNDSSDEDTDIIASALDDFYLKKDNLSYYKSYPMTEEEFDGVLTTDGISCRVSWKITNKNESGDHYNYMFFYYSGTRSFDKVYNGGIDICSVVFCKNLDGYESCAERYSTYSDIDWPFTIQELSITANFAVSTSSIQYPNTLLSSIRPLDRSSYEWSAVYSEDGSTVGRTLKLLNPQSRLLTFGIYGRDFSRDSSASAGCSSFALMLTTILFGKFIL